MAIKTYYWHLLAFISLKGLDFNNRVSVKKLLMHILDILTTVCISDAQIKPAASQFLGDIRKHNYNHSIGKYIYKFKEFCLKVYSSSVADK